MRSVSPDVILLAGSRCFCFLCATQHVNSPKALLFVPDLRFSWQQWMVSMMYYRCIVLMYIIKLELQWITDWLTGPLGLHSLNISGFMMDALDHIIFLKNQPQVQKNCKAHENNFGLLLKCSVVLSGVVHVTSYCENGLTWNCFIHSIIHPHCVSNKRVNAPSLIKETAVLNYNLIFSLKLNRPVLFLILPLVTTRHWFALRAAINYMWSRRID